MRGWLFQRRRRNRVVAIAILGLSLLTPLDAVALDSDLKGSAVFKLKASRGYTILGFASSERIDGRGDIGLIVYRKGAAVFYAAPATVTPTRLEADLGALGRFSAEIVPTGKKKRLRSRCDDGARTVEPDVYRGIFEFHGEQGYTEAVATDVPEYPQFFLDFGCLSVSRGEVWGRGLPGARLRAFSRRHDRRVSLQLNKNRPGKATIFEATLAEVRNGIEIERTVSGSSAGHRVRVRLAAEDGNGRTCGSLLRCRRLPPRCRSGQPLDRNLSIDFPGKPNVPLAGSAFSVHAVHARRMG